MKKVSAVESILIWVLAINRSVYFKTKKAEICSGFDCKLSKSCCVIVANLETSALLETFVLNMSYKLGADTDICSACFIWRESCE